jgi:predicted MPP superfamily phosphohydrolase
LKISGYLKVGLIAICFLVLLFVYGYFIEPNQINLREIKIHSDSINNFMEDKKIIHLSDLHLSGFGKNEIKILNMVDKIDPDLLFLTGDYIKWKGDNKPALKFLSRLKAKHGVFAVMGDYDYSDSKNSCLFCHERGSGKPTKQHPVIMLRNSLHEITIDGKKIQIAGIDEGYEELNDFKGIDTTTDKNSLLLVLSHSPFAFDQFSPKNKMIMFAGDTHGGQVKLPRWLFKLLGYEKNVRYNYGLYHQGNKTMYVTRGTGTSHIRFRLFCPPEIAVLRFSP